jgi:hypothetical protein
MRCEDVAQLLPEAVDGEASVHPAVHGHVESCLRCQAELARYRRMLRALQALRLRYLEPDPGLLAQTLLALSEEGERRALRSLISGRRLAYAGAIAGGAVAAGATTVAVILGARARRRPAAAA